jgi:hypothetical protein
VSKHERVDFVNALGSVLAVSLKDSAGSGKSFFIHPAHYNN